MERRVITDKVIAAAQVVAAKVPAVPAATTAVTALPVLPRAAEAAAQATAVQRAAAQLGALR
jgi:hypothetical protein